MTDVVLELTVVGGADAVDLACADLWAAGATAVAETDAGGDAGAGKGLVKLVASFPTADAARVVAAEVGGAVVEITDTSWQDRWKDFAGPVAVGPDLVIAPAWRDVVLAPDGEDRGAGPGPLIIRIDPGPCFGSGSHPSSRLILALLMDLDPHRGPGGVTGGGVDAGEVDARRPRRPLAGCRVLDVGCGSGILSVAAALLGAEVTAVDIDPAAVVATEANASANGVAPLIRASTDPPAQAGSDFDVAVVNVTAGVHAIVGAATAEAVRSGGTILLAGLLPGQWHHVAGTYPATTIVERPRLEGWEGVVLVKA